MLVMAGPTDVTRILSKINAGEGAAANELLPLLYQELRSMAAAQFRSQRSDHTLQPTVLVHEAFIKLLGQDARWQDRRHFFAVAAIAMRQILVNHARDKNAQKRGGGKRATELDDNAVGTETPLDVLALHEALEKLESIDPRKHKVVELRFFGGLTVDEIAEVMELSRSTIEAEWRAARAWLAATLT
jgi:RNA polymerase sigma factor (TIGR02999 family)